MENLQIKLVKLWHILEGTFRNIFRLYPNYSYKRLRICNSCKNKEYIPLFGYCCNQCGCIIKSKICVKNEKCPADKW